MLRELRELAELKQSELAAAAGLNHSTWARIERGESACTIDQLALTASRLNVLPGAVIDIADSVAAVIKARGIAVEHKRWVVAPTVADSKNVAIPNDALAPTVREVIAARAKLGPGAAASLESGVNILAQAAEEASRPGADRSIAGIVAMGKAAGNRAYEAHIAATTGQAPGTGRRVQPKATNGRKGKQSR